VLLAQELKAEKSHLYLQAGDILVNSMGEGTLGRVSRNLSQSDRMIIHNCITVLRADTRVLGQELLYYQVAAAQDYFESIGQGSTGQTSLKVETIKSLNIFRPSDSIQRLFQSNVQPMWNQVGNIKRQTVQLLKARDLLLPHLMNRAAPE